MIDAYLEEYREQLGPVQEDEKKYVYSVFAGVYREIIQMGIEENPVRYEKDYDGRREYVGRLAQMCSNMFFWCGLEDGLI